MDLFNIISSLKDSSFAVLLLAYAVVCVLGTCLLFIKTGREWWEALIPFYSAYVLWVIIKGKEKGLHWFILSLIAGFVPFLGFFFSVAIGIYCSYLLSKCFTNNEAWKTVFAIVLLPIYGVYIYKSQDQYIGPNQDTNVIGGITF